MTPRERKALLAQRLQPLDPQIMEITDESHFHAGHPGALTGASHFALRISSPKFKGLSPVACHRLIYSLVGDLIPVEVHALKIRVIDNKPLTNDHLARI